MAVHFKWNDADFKKAFGEVLRELRHQRGISQEALAEASDCHVNYISFLERGINSPTLILVFQLAVALRNRPGDLVLRVEDRLQNTPQEPQPD